MYTTLIDPAALAAHTDDADWLIVDCRHDLVNLAAGRDAYAGGHLPNAVFADIEHELSGTKRDAGGAFRGRHPLPEKDAFVELLRAWGVNDATQVVAYDAHGGMFAARLWWMLRWVGHEAVAVLDGGLPAWQSAGLPVSIDAPAPRARGTIAARAPLVTSVDVNTVLHNVEHGGRTVVDARAPDRFRGENETIDPVGGHIPGAKNRFFKDNLQPDGRFKAPDQLKAELGAAVGDPQNAIMQCGSGVTACHNLLALEVAGMPGAALYPGSWSEWSADAARPVATGAQ
ncbi:3-mercaptopyruvate sulfurtransferase [Massilia sp. WF1]|uniref:sulfurtransferase n=1 Tax=unclassified Massilia TaxID=2609279 RepID=UPI000690949D|nr:MULTISPECIES: sulfurtransferase [unclassified Massilia]ALK95774.1 3-mercaptopyruvate sulfurtransferase [Massilia sp. WG5]KNZ68007.1 3-mercaptopyruvate sulfurtransferase [Massilia sp. WF1]